jgi:hypothetical protein
MLLQSLYDLDSEKMWSCVKKYLYGDPNKYMEMKRGLKGSTGVISESAHFLRHFLTSDFISN